MAFLRLVLLILAAILPLMEEQKKADILKKGDFQVKQLISFFMCCIVCAGAVAAVQPDAFSGADISIRFHDRTVYYPGSSPSEPVMIQVTIANRGAGTIRFKIADDHFFSLDFTALNTRSRALDHTELWVRNRSSSRQVYFREVSIEPGESYAFTENLKDYLSIETPGMYILDCAFYPELKRLSDDSETSVRSNRLTLEVKPSPGAASAKVLPVSPETAAVLQPQSLPPDQVITYALTARQKSLWEQFFLYLDLEQMITRDPSRGRGFRAESENGRFTMIENYKSELRQEKVESDISTIPVEFSIERTTYTESKGTVTVLEWFDYRTFREKKRFTYYLESRDGIWRIYDYTVDNLGTE
jgi:hypothetical protein